MVSCPVKRIEPPHVAERDLDPGFGWRRFGLLDWRRLGFDLQRREAVKLADFLGREEVVAGGRDDIDSTDAADALFRSDGKRKQSREQLEILLGVILRGHLQISPQAAFALSVAAVLGSTVDDPVFQISGDPIADARGPASWGLIAGLEHPRLGVVLRRLVGDRGAVLGRGCRTSLHPHPACEAFQLLFRERYGACDELL
jgi:hypothetical protein